MTGRGPRLLVVNPNSDPAVTALIRAAAARVLPPGAAFRVESPPGAPSAIETPAHRAQVEEAVAALIAGAANCDAAALGCFDDIGADRARTLGSAPVVDAVAAAALAARAAARRFAVVTTVEAATPGIRARLAALGAAEVCAVRAAGVGVGAAAAREPEAMARLAETARRAVEEDGAEAIILGSGGLAGLAEPVGRVAGVRVIDAIEAAVATAWAVAAIGR